MALFADSVSWLAVGSLAAAVSQFGLIGLLARHRGKPGANWLVATLSAQGVWCLGYGLGALVTDPGVRIGLEMFSWLGFLWTGFLFLSFALDYTGRSDLRTSWLYLLLGIVPTVGSVMVVTDPWYGLAWRNAHLVGVYGASVLAYAIQPWGYLVVAVGLTYAGIGALLLVDTVLSYGPLYRREALAVALSPIPPLFGLAVWFLDLGPISVVNWGVILALLHAGLDAYAFVGTDMFSTSPATRRVADQSALDTLPEPVVILDERRRIVDFNDAATDIFGELESDAVGSIATAVLPVESLPLDDGVQYAQVTTGDRRYEFAVRSSPLTDSRGTLVGYTVSFQDVTQEREREQRLEVLNRVLRHNLRNELTTINGYAAHIEETTDDPELAELATRIADSGQDLTDIGEKARTFDRLRKMDTTFQRVDPGAILSGVVETLSTTYPAATIDARLVTVDSHVRADGDPELGGDGTLFTDPQLLTLALENVVENAVLYDESAAPSVRIVVRESDDEDFALAIDVIDEGPGIPESELAVLEYGAESDLEHGSGIGLWIVEWSLDRLGGHARFESCPSGTTVTLLVPSNPPDGEGADTTATRPVSGTTHPVGDEEAAANERS